LRMRGGWRAPTPGGAGSGFRRGRRPFACQLPLWLYICVWLGLVCICGGCLAVGPSVVGRDWRPASSNAKLAVAAVELQVTTEPHCSRGVQPGGICACAWYIASRLPEVRGRACAGATSASQANCRSGPIYTCLPPQIACLQKRRKKKRPSRGTFSPLTQPRALPSLFFSQHKLYLVH
jgi:hypothetical protein